MKVLYVDTDSPSGHINFNKIYIQALQQKGIEIKLALQKGYIRKLALPETMLAIELPEWMYKKGRSGKILSRLYMLGRLIYLRTRLSLQNYDYVLFSSYEEISFYFSGLKAPNFILVNHRNVAGLASRLKCFFLRKISSRIQYHIVFEEYMKLHYNRQGIFNVKVVAHGLPQPYCPESGQKEVLGKLLTGVSAFRYIIFSPSSSSSDLEEQEKLIRNERFNEYLEKNEILFVIKGNYKNENKKNIRVLNTYLAQCEYETLFLHSDLILICYPAAFDFCVSAVLFECIANNKPCIASDIRALRVFSKYINGGCFFSHPEQLTDCIDKVLHNPKKEWYCRQDLLMPDFGFLFSTAG